MSGISLLVEEPGWRRSGVELAGIRRAAGLARLRGAPERTQVGLSVLLANDERLRMLNAQFRGNNTPTNVLAFPAARPNGEYAGDVAIALGVAEREASRAGIGIGAHAVHLTVHGVLHLLGYDHISTREARIMERLEVAILNELGLPCPYGRAAVE
ncbi:MAG TPA: rRNA maturation RNase YbeY [Rhizomicrobium sp.]|jgi:probable rRNA maturation factor